VLLFHYFFRTNTRSPISRALQSALAELCESLVRPATAPRVASGKIYRKSTRTVSYWAKFYLSPGRSNILMCFGNGTPSRRASKTGHQGDQRQNDANHGRVITDGSRNGVAARLAILSPVGHLNGQLCQPLRPAGHKLDNSDCRMPGPRISDTARACRTDRIQPGPCIPRPEVNTAADRHHANTE
jgi:hypothetical protein